MHRLTGGSPLSIGQIGLALARWSVFGQDVPIMIRVQSKSERGGLPTRSELLLAAGHKRLTNAEGYPANKARDNSKKPTGL